MNNLCNDGLGGKKKLPKMRSGCSLVGLQSHCVNKGEAVQLRLVDFTVCLTHGAAESSGVLTMFRMSCFPFCR